MSSQPMPNDDPNSGSEIDDFDPTGDYLMGQRSDSDHFVINERYVSDTPESVEDEPEDHAGDGDE
ncbi:hypothetical protein SH501x_002085 [Pirellulaceae bacterium SH501]